MHVLMTAFGSYGDVHPIAGLGDALAKRGHTVTMIANPHFRSVVESAGAELVPLGTVEEYREMTNDPDLWHPTRGPMLVLEIAIVKYLRDVYRLIEKNHRAGETVLVSHPLDLASRVFQEAHSVPLANAILSPVSFRSLHQTPKMTMMLSSGWTPRWLRQFQFWLADKLVVDRRLSPEVNALRQELGLATPAEGILKDWFLSPQLVLGLFPEWFAPTQPDWPEQIRLTGFPLWDQPSAAGLPEEVEDFLRGGEPPIVFTPGSAMAHGRQFFQAAVDACRLLGRRGILLTKYPEQLPTGLPDEVRHFPFVPFSQLLPRAGAFVHHGGIGSCSQGLAAGLPQLLMPMAYDQPDNAERLNRLGVANEISPKRFKGAAVAKALDVLLTDQTTNERAHHWAKQCNGAAALSAACEALEGLGT